jgi:hypothetical protein
MKHLKMIAFIENLKTIYKTEDNLNNREYFFDYDTNFSLKNSLEKNFNDQLGNINYDIKQRIL